MSCLKIDLRIATNIWMTCSKFQPFTGIESSTSSDKDDGFEPNAFYLEDYWHQGNTTEDKIFKSNVACENKEIFGNSYF